METKLNRRSLYLCAFLLLSLSACRGVGIDEFDQKSPIEPTKEEKDESSWWDYFYGQKKAGLESKQWKDYYKTPAEDATKPNYCGYWGNCAVNTAPQQEECDYYGNCKGKTGKQGWW